MPLPFIEKSLTVQFGRQDGPDTTTKQKFRLLCDRFPKDVTGIAFTEIDTELRDDVAVRINHGI